MPSLNSKYTDEFRDRTVKYILDSHESASSIGEELGVDKNTICSWVREYRRKNHLPSDKEEQEIRGKSAKDSKAQILKMKEDKRRILELEEEVEILKTALHIFMQAPK
jgi:transposase